MRISMMLKLAGIFSAAGVACFLGARQSVSLLENITQQQIEITFAKDGITWANVDTNGLQVYIIGTANDEASRFAAISSASKVVDAARVIDQVSIAENTDIVPSQYALEILRNKSGVTLMGLVPKSIARDTLVRAISDAANQAPVSDLLDIADHKEPPLWNEALIFGVKAIQEFERAKVSVRPDGVTVIATAKSAERRAAGLGKLQRAIPEGLEVEFNITAPRPVISPFVLRAVYDEDGYRYDACSAPDEAAAQRLIDAGRAYGLDGETDCAIGLGMPTGNWVEGAIAAAQALGDLGQGQLNVIDTDISLTATAQSDPKVYEKVTSKLERALKEPLALYANRIDRSQEEILSALEFRITRSEDGTVLATGALSTELDRDMARSVAAAAFGADNLTLEVELEPQVPTTWVQRVLTAMRALDLLEFGQVGVTLDTFTISGNSYDPAAGQMLTALITEQLGEGSLYDLNIVTMEAKDNSTSTDPKSCLAALQTALNGRKINFEPGSARLDVQARDILDDIAEVLDPCPDLPLQINGYTDSQGRAEMNLTLSQQRAETVLSELRLRRILTSTFRAEGFGEQNPIANNDTEEGREANRRIEFTLYDTAPDQASENADTEPSNSDATDTTNESDANG